MRLEAAKPIRITCDPSLGGTMPAEIARVARATPRRPQNRSSEARRTRKGREEKQQHETRLLSSGCHDTTSGECFFLLLFFFFGLFPNKQAKSPRNYKPARNLWKQIATTASAKSVKSLVIEIADTSKKECRARAMKKAYTDPEWTSVRRSGAWRARKKYQPAIDRSINQSINQSISPSISRAVNASSYLHRLPGR